MSTTNLVEEVIVPETPNTVGNQVMHFFVPLGNYNYPGALKPYNRHFNLYDQGLFVINLNNLSTDLQLDRFDDKVDKVNPQSSGNYTHDGNLSVVETFTAGNYQNPKSEGEFEHDGDFSVTGDVRIDGLTECDEIKTDVLRILQNAQYKNFNDIIAAFAVKQDPITEGTFQHNGDFNCSGDFDCSGGFSCDHLDVTGYGSFETINSQSAEIDTLQVTTLINTEFSNVKTRSELNRVNLVNLSAQVQGIARTYAIADFMTFIDFMNGNYSISISEDRNGDGLVEYYTISVSDLKTGDNIVIIEHNVPDFWFEKTTDTTTKETYEYNDQIYELIAPNIGLMHKSETDYVVIENYARSASISADNAEQSAFEAKDSENKSTELFESVENLVNSLYTKQVAPPLSLLDKAMILTTPTLAQI